MPMAPPAPQIASQWAWPVAIVSAGLGVLLVVWGEKYHRAALAMVGGAVGLLLGGSLAPYLGLTPLAGQIAIPMVLAVLAVIGAHFVWAIVAAGLALGAAGWAVICHFASPETRRAAGGADELAEWARSAWGFGTSGIADAWQANALVVVLALFPATVVPLIVGLLKPRLATVAVTAMLGAGAMVFGVLLGLTQIRQSWWSDAMTQYGVAIAAIAAITTFGMIFQYRRILAAERSKGDQEDQKDTPPEKGGKVKKND